MAYSPDTICLFIDHLKPSSRSRWLLNWLNVVASSGYHTRVYFLDPGVDLRVFLRPVIQQHLIHGSTLYKHWEMLKVFVDLKDMRFQHIHFAGQAYKDFLNIIWWVKGKYFWHVLPENQDLQSKKARAFTKKIHQKLCATAVDKTTKAIHYPVLVYPAIAKPEIRQTNYFLISRKCYESEMFKKDWQPFWEHVPPGELLIYGGKSNPDKPGITFLGEYWDMTGLYESARGLIRIRPATVQSYGILEAMAMGKPVFAAGFLPPEFTNLIWQVPHPKDLQEAMQAVSSEQLRAAKHYIESDFSPVHAKQAIDAVHGIKRKEKGVMDI
jgi:hypothetical protein